MDLAVADLREVVETAVARAGHLLTAGEMVVVGRILGLSGDPARAYARLTARVPEVFPLEELDGVAIDGLIEAELADRLVPWDVRAKASTKDALAEGCRRFGLPVGGRRDDLIARLAGRKDWSERRWVRIRHRGLVRRLERIAMMRVSPDRSAFVIERMGVVRWPRYEPTPGALWADRRAWNAWEELRRSLRAMSPEACLAALAGPTGPAGLDLRPWLRERVREAGRLRERDGDPAGARALYVGIDEVLRVARTYEAEGRPAEALRVLREARGRAGPVDRRAIGRSGKRLARTLREGWAPDPPLLGPFERTLGLEPGTTTGARPRWRVGEGEHVVEWAVRAMLAEAGRTCIVAEGPLWTTLYAVLFRDAYFLPVPGALPARRLYGPIDVGTPGFAKRRAEAVARALEEGPERVREVAERHHGEALAGAAWQVASAAQLGEVAVALGPALRCVLTRLLDEGWEASRGLPDLVVLPGPEVRLPGHPGRLGAAPVLVEVKGPGDQVRDEQAVWFDVLMRAGVAVEVWNVVPREAP